MRPIPCPTSRKRTARCSRGRGARFGANLKAAQTFASRLPVGLQTAPEESGLVNDPTVLETFAAWGAGMLAAERKIVAIRMNREHPAHNPDHREHELARGILGALYRKGHGTRPVLKVG